MVEAGVLSAVAFGPAWKGQEIEVYARTTLELHTFVAFVVVAAVATRELLWGAVSTAIGAHIPRFLVQYHRLHIVSKQINLIVGIDVPSLSVWLFLWVEGGRAPFRPLEVVWTCSFLHLPGTS